MKLMCVNGNIIRFGIHDMIYRRMLEVVGKLKNRIYCLFYRGGSRYCPVCKATSSKFLKGGLVHQRDDARCPCCSSYERYRLAWFYLENVSDLFDGESKKVLHIAPEKCFGSRIKERVGGGYISADLYNPLAMEKMDIMDIKYPDSYFNVIYCNHVLEHVENDIKAISEFYRVLAIDGWILLQVPINTDVTFEDPSITDPKERLKVFGQTDHVRNYGADFVGRVKSVGFKVETILPEGLLSPEEVKRMGINKKYAGELFVCTK